MEFVPSSLESEILRTLAYFDVFSYPLTKKQVYAFLSCNFASQKEFDEAVAGLLDAGRIRSDRGYYFFADRPEAVVSSREENEKRAAEMFRRAGWVSLFLRQVPYVRAIFVTGSLSKNVAHRSSDIDFMIVTTPDRLWICKMILTAFRRIVLFNSNKYFCINLMVSEDSLTYHHRNVFTAIEIATTRVLWGVSNHQKFLSVNDWIAEYLPHWQPDNGSTRRLPEHRSPLQRMIESVLNLFRLESLDRRLMDTARNYWLRKNRHLDEAVFNSLYQCRRNISSVWSGNHQASILTAYHHRLAHCGVEART